MNEKKYRVKGYKHLDNKKSIEKVKSKIQNPRWVAKHGFYPFMHFEIKFQKYSRKEKKRKEKVRKIFYASHMDSYIYKYYGDKLNNHYNSVVDELGINEVATAYRNNLSGKSNINFAKEVIDFIKVQQSAYIFVADFTNFFDTLDHRYLKEKIRYVLKKDTLPDDYYNVFKNITRFSYFIKDTIEAELKTKYTESEIESSYKYFTEKEFRAFKHKNIYKNSKRYGIPQGAGISSVCSNIYLLDFDKKIQKYVKEQNGLYRRYCDDLIIVIPIEGGIQDYNYQIHQKILEDIKEQIPNLEIQLEKTGNYFYNDNQIIDLDLNETILDYLGFSFNGKEVRIREKSLFKYYTRAYRKVRICNRKSKKFGRKSYRRELYKNYSHLGKSKKGHGNFISYVERAQKIFDEDSKTINLMETQVKKHWKNIQSRLEQPE
ncbi:reverse transcriptase [Bacillus subtilis]|uniref:reverse transcriptase domain-containing protein n=1 Tax=Bacillus TaxID=1386 RepID=UPI000426279C|nr:MULTISPECIES: reverse transcriptase domain-containing protein [Bacillus]AXP50486.1 reverse transcriptase [Bacillus subtilis subsp. subtilis]KUP31530.1 reverse transcriptase [Bacillus halotolerans]MBU8593502.1 reverse transcriptase [Bacillus subtilis]MBY0127619.1 reverse transcriptase [Bacillus subtilis]MBY0182664.1 reverse transcriptase [Bacillus subtilis]